jgi:hypothetical protein
VADLAAVPTVADHQAAPDDDSGADAQVAVQVDDVVDAHRHAPDVLGQSGDVGQVTGHETGATAELRLQCDAECLVDAGDPDPAVLVPGGVGDRGGAADQQRVGGHGPFHVPDQVGEGSDGVHRRQATGSRDLPPIEDLPTEADPGGP